MPRLRRFLLIDALPLEADQLALWVATEDDTSRRLLWPGAPPPLPPDGPMFAPRTDFGELLWAEGVPTSAVRLQDLTPPLAGTDAAELFRALASALARLHAAGLAHGDLDADRVFLTADGPPLLVGIGRRAAIPSDDLDALQQLWTQWTPEDQTTPTNLDWSNASELTAALTEWLAGQPVHTPNLPVRIQNAQRRPREDADLSLALEALEVGMLDEVEVDIGPDESPVGLLDMHTWSRVTGEPTSELTGAMPEVTSTDSPEDTRIDAPQSALLARLLQATQQPPPNRFALTEGRPSRSVHEMIASEPLDLLPTPDGLPARSAAVAWEEITATAVRDYSPPPQSFELSPRQLTIVVVATTAAATAGVWLMLYVLSS